MYPNPLEFAPKCIIVIDWIIYVTPFDSHQGFEQGVVEYLGFRNGVVVGVWLTKAIVESTMKKIEMNAWITTSILYTMTS